MKFSLIPLSVVPLICAVLTACDSGSAAVMPRSDMTTHQLLPEVALVSRMNTNAREINEEAPIPAQCYTRTDGAHNPCYVCHQSYDRRQESRMNKLDDGGIQGAYIFSDVGTQNHWLNLFQDKSEWVDKITDEHILRYVRQDNYSELKPRLTKQNWEGYIPDIANFAQGEAAFDEEGFAKDGSAWVAFNYKPFPSTFWPTNGASDDVLVRLPKPFREQQGSYDRRLYQLNLAVLELNLKQLASIAIPPTDELSYGVDLNGDDQYSVVSELKARAHYLGDAATRVVVQQQYPEGTEFLHSVRYLDVLETGDIAPSARMKELRYMRKIRELDESDLDNRYRRERKEKLLEELPSYVNRYQQGQENGMGWMLLGFIEDYDGALRPQTFEEGFACMGCHAAIGTTIDQTFSFARKITGPTGWGYINLHGMNDAPSVAEAGGEILNYLKRVGGGNEFRENAEMRARWFTSDGSVDEQKVAKADVYQLISPSPERALALNKAYTYIVRHQSYVLGRDANVSAAVNVHKSIDESIAPLNSDARYLNWDIRLAW